MKAILTFFLILNLLTEIQAQLIGNRGVFTLPPGVEYRDAVTREASKLVGKFARMFQKEEEKIKKNRPPKPSKPHTPFFGPQVISPGRLRTPAEVLDFQDSRFLNPLPELRKNRKLEEIEVERSTSRERLLPDPRDPPGIPLGPSDQFSMFEAVPTPPGNILNREPVGQKGISVRMKSNKHPGPQLSPPSSSFGSNDFMTQSVPSDGGRSQIFQFAPIQSAPPSSQSRMINPKITLDAAGRHPDLVSRSRGVVRRIDNVSGNAPRHPTTSPGVFDRTPSSLSDVNSDLISKNIFGLSRMKSFVVHGPNYYIYWG